MWSAPTITAPWLPNDTLCDGVFLLFLREICTCGHRCVILARACRMNFPVIDALRKNVCGSAMTNAQFHVKQALFGGAQGSDQLHCVPLPHYIVQASQRRPLCPHKHIQKGVIISQDVRMEDLPAHASL